MKINNSRLASIVLISASLSGLAVCTIFNNKDLRHEAKYKIEELDINKDGRTDYNFISEENILTFSSNTDGTYELIDKTNNNYSSR